MAFDLGHLDDGRTPRDEREARNKIERILSVALAPYVGAPLSRAAETAIVSTAKDAIARVSDQAGFPAGYFVVVYRVDSLVATVAEIAVDRDFRRFPMLAEEFEQRTGVAPQGDDLARANCSGDGCAHSSCGWDIFANRPAWWR